MSDTYTMPLRLADEAYAQSVEFCETGCSAPVVVTEPESLCGRCVDTMLDSCKHCGGDGWTCCRCESKSSECHCRDGDRIEACDWCNSEGQKQEP